MKYFLIFIFAVFSAAISFEEENFEQILPTILGGSETQWGQFPSSVIIDGPHDFCGGSIIDSRHILTAASCVLNSRFEIINPIYWRVIAGDIFFTPPSSRRVTRSVSRILLQSDYQPFNGENNLAILRLDSPLPLPSNTIEIARRQTRIIRDALQCQLVGFGRTVNVTNTALRTRQIVLPQTIMNRDACANNFPHTNRLSERMICTQTAVNSAPCSGSLGSGLYCNGFLTGVLSGGNFCNAVPAVYQQVRAFNTWIDQVIADRSNSEQLFTPFDTRGFPTPQI
ncbi:hypothetical protein PVAND_014977 [Polypedilum vanderplanki]|uniref:Peptidase S1 domain-containing protein n=1 Tax=Polypedilum vanderplanki TaxID=319348 RepID=A0A9J6BB98_POLVA|nr:hypothetical protein PVAND_014977 [Polypedilum vanderplanki]